MELAGKIVTILPLVTGQGKNGPWKKQDFVIETDGQYPKKACFSLWGDKIDQARLTENMMVTVYFDVESREYNGRWYTEMRAWKVSSGGQAPQQSSSAITNTETFTESTPDFNDTTDDLPF